MKSKPSSILARTPPIVHDFRSSLDHIVHEVILLKEKREPRTKQNQFPIFETEPGFNERGVGTFLKEISDVSVIELIRSEQPFSTGEHTKSPLWHLKELSDADKHRTLQLTGNLLQSFHVELPLLRYPVTVTRLNVAHAGPRHDHAILWQRISPMLVTGPSAPEDPQTGKPIYYVPSVRDVPPDVPLIAGDAVQKPGQRP